MKIDIPAVYFVVRDKDNDLIELSSVEYIDEEDLISVEYHVSKKVQTTISMKEYLEFLEDDEN